MAKKHAMRQSRRNEQHYGEASRNHDHGFLVALSFFLVFRLTKLKSNKSSEQKSSPPGDVSLSRNR